MSPDQIRDISEKIYKIRLAQDHHDNVERMLEKDGDGGVKLRKRAGFYDSLTRAYLEVLGFKEQT
jgi:hypothetical protein